MNALRRVGVAVLLVLGLSLSATASAGAAPLSLAPGEYFIDTGTLTLEDTGGPIATGVDEGGVAVFAFDSVDLPAGVEIFAEGNRPLEIKSAGAFNLGGFIEASGFGPEGTNQAGPFPGGPGGGAGGANGTQGGSGPGGGGAGATNPDGGGGGGFGGPGAGGGTFSGVEAGKAGGAPGNAYGNLNAVLQGGSGGAGGSNGGGGGGGGAVMLSAASLTIAPSGEVLVDGADGNGNGSGASGGGSGGGILLRAGTLSVAGLLTADGGDGGTGGCCGDGGGGGGGRIAYQFRTLSLDAGTISVAGGASGVSGPFSHGGLSPDLAGASGVVTKSPPPGTSTVAATAISSKGATLNGIVNPNGIGTTYRFELGTTTAYGTNVPVPNGAAGSDSANHALSQAVSGLSAHTTYHYRIVAVNGAGFETAGADMTFTTPRPCEGLKIAPGRVKVKNGKAPIRLSSSADCKGNLALFMKAPPKGKAKGHGKGKASASKKGKGKGGKSIQIGSASFSLDVGQTKTVEVTLSAAALKRLRSGKALPATAKATTSDAAAAKKTTQANVSLKLAKKGKGPKKGKGSRKGKGPK